MKTVYILYCLGLILLTMFSWLFIDPNLIYFKNLYTGFYTQRFLVSLVYFVLISFLFILFWKITQKEKNYNRTRKIILILCGILLFSYPAFLSFDIFNYIATAKVLFHYHENPYIMMPIEFVGDPMLLFMHAANKVALYGPFWILISGFPFILGVNNFLAILISFKVFNIVFFLLSLKIIYSITKKTEDVIYFALNPLVVTEALISSHNDIVMMFFALAGILFLIKKRIFLGLLFIIFSIFIKYATLFLLPVVIYLLYQHYFSKKIDQQKIFFWSFSLMFIIFFLSFIREEIYPWYFIWPLAFACLLSGREKFKKVLIGLSYGLMLRYIPFMLTGSYFGLTPIAKTTLMVVPPAIFVIYFAIKKYAK